MINIKLIIIINLLILTFALLLTKDIINFYTIKNKGIFSPRIIISLTTSPKRIKKIDNVIDSILNQTVEVDYIHLNLPHVFKRDNSRFKEIPQYLIDNPKVILNFCEDLGPATKIIPTVKSNFTNYSDIIISIDDDTYYPPNLVENHIYYHSFYPNAVLTGTSIFLDHKKRYMDTLIKCELLEGFSSVLYKKSFLENIPLDIFDKQSVPIYHYLSDDLVLSNYILKSGIEIICLTKENKAINSIKQFDFGFKNDALHKGATGAADCKINTDCNKSNYIKTMKYLKEIGDYNFSKNYLTG